MDEYEKSIAEFLETMADLFVAKAGIFCVSENPSSHLMLSQYANSRAVFCIGFKVDSELMQSRFLGPVIFSPRGEKIRVNVVTQLGLKYKVNITDLADVQFDILCEKSE